MLDFFVLDLNYKRAWSLCQLARSSCVESCDLELEISVILHVCDCVASHSTRAAQHCPDASAWAQLFVHFVVDYLLPAVIDRRHPTECKVRWTTCHWHQINRCFRRSRRS